MFGLTIAALTALWAAAEAPSPAPEQLVERETGGASRQKAPPQPAPPDDEYVAFRRRGLFIRTSAGLTLCGQAFCDSIPVGGLGRADFGYRIGLFSLLATVSGGGARLDIPDFESNGEVVSNVRGGLTVLYAGAGLVVHPLDFGRVDPFVGVSFGYSRVQQRLTADQGEAITTFGRGGVELGTGIDVFVGRRVALGPRFDAVLPFGGTQCTGTTDLRECVNIVDLTNSDVPAIERQRRRDFPKPWSLTVNATFYLQ